MRNKDEQHNEMRNYVEELMNKGLTDQDIADVLGIEIGSRFIKFPQNGTSIVFWLRKIKRKQ
jgi:cytochrome c-type biogenesis protein CcmH/NrfF